MTAKEKYIEEKDELKNARIKRIYESSFYLFALKGIDTIAMTDIAAKAEIGVASLYRYFSTKDEIAIQTVIWAWEKQKEKLLPTLNTKEYKQKIGIEQLQHIFSLFINLYLNESDFLRFIYFFDSYAVRTGIDAERLQVYEKEIESIKEYVIQAIEKGIKDNSINKKFSEMKEILYFTIMHALFSMSQKLTLSGNMLKMDAEVSGKTELEQLSELLIEGLK